MLACEILRCDANPKLKLDSQFSPEDRGCSPVLCCLVRGKYSISRMMIESRVTSGALITREICDKDTGVTAVCLSLPSGR